MRVGGTCGKAEMSQAGAPPTQAPCDPVRPPSGGDRLRLVVCVLPSLLPTPPHQLGDVRWYGGTVHVQV